MVIMENYCSPHDRFKELWVEIDRCHLIYLEMEESPEKLERRNKLEEYIREYLCIAPHCDKFAYSETEEVLLRSANNKKDFSGYKAATGFNTIQLYAGNLLSQPWRKEYQQIKTYCGFYKHQIEANLVGAEIIFKAMGYKHDGDGILFLEGPVCPDRVTAISKDCLVAYVECQILKAIWEEVSTHFLKITWQEVLDFRKTHFCSPEQCVKALKYKQHQRQYQEHTRSYSLGSDPYSNNVRHHPVPVQNQPATASANPSFQHLNHHHMVSLPASSGDYVYSNSGCCSKVYGNFVPPCYLPYTTPLMKPPFNVNGYCYNGMMSPQLPGYQYAVPTAQLIELESHNGASHEVVDRGTHKPKYSQVINNDLYKIKNNNMPADRESEKNSSQFEGWDYVYRDLESQGYSKDLGERGDILSPSSSRLLQESRKMKATNLDEAVNKLTLSNRPQKITEALKKLEREKSKLSEVVKVDKQTSPSSSYENLAKQDFIKKQSPKSVSAGSNTKTKTLPREAMPSVISANEKQFNSGKKPKEDRLPVQKDHVDSILIDKWHCKVCTFLNEDSKDICVMCGKSRFPVTDQPIEIGGAECRSCTLVNPKNEKSCQACNKSLENSATYI